MNPGSSSFDGVLSAPVTPYERHGEAIDHAGLERLVETQIAAGITALLPCGTTGESTLLCPDEHRDVVRCVAQAASGRVPVFAGVGSSNTATSVRLAKAAIAAGADGIMVGAPAYVRPCQRGLAAHILAVARAVERPVVLYDNPRRTGVDLEPTTTELLAEHAPNVIALKDSTGNVMRLEELHRRLGDRLALLAGEDDLVVASIAVGARGLASAAANVAPREMVSLVCEARAGRYEHARAIQERLLPLLDLLFQSHPSASKAALMLLGVASDTVRPPLARASEPLTRALRDELARLGLLENRHYSAEGASPSGSPEAQR